MYLCKFVETVVKSQQSTILERTRSLLRLATTLFSSFIPVIKIRIEIIIEHRVADARSFVATFKQ